MDEEPLSITFSPPLYIQRYQTVFNEVHKVCLEIADARKPDITEIKIADVGCNDASFFKYIKNGFETTALPWKTHYYGVDCDAVTLEQGIYRVTPLTTDSLVTRSGPLQVSLYEGDILHPAVEMLSMDVLVMIEVIEHIPLHPVQNQLGKILFHELRPSAVIMTTPNSEFNVMFGAMKFGQFRHEDHKFEWTRQEFQTWCLDAILGSEYSVDFSGIGDHCSAPADIGSCSQMAVFRRNIDRVPPVSNAVSLSGSFKLIYHHEYFFRPHLTTKQCATFALKNHLSSICHKFESGLIAVRHVDDEVEDEDEMTFTIGDKCWRGGDVLFLDRSGLLNINVAYLSEFLSNQHEIEDGFIESVIEDYSDSDYSLSADKSTVIFCPPSSDSSDNEEYYQPHESGPFINKSYLIVSNIQKKTTEKDHPCEVPILKHSKIGELMDEINLDYKFT